jgi:hypothetical protein
MSGRKGKKSLSLAKNKPETKASPATDIIQDGDDPAPSLLASSTDTQHNRLASQLKEILSSDGRFIDTLADTVASVLLNSTQLVNSITEKLRSSIQDEVSQHVYRALSMDMEKHTIERSKLLEEQKVLAKQIATMETKLDEYEQYSRRNCLLIHGIAEKDDENTNSVATNTIAKYLDVSVTNDDIDRTHRLGPKLKRSHHNSGESNTKSQASARPIIIKFCSYAKRDQIFKVKSRLKKTGIIITENLTAKRMQLLNDTKKHESVRSAWSIDGRIQCITFTDKYINIKNASDLARL